MKKMFYILFLAPCLFLFGCDNGRSGSFYDEYTNDIVTDNSSEVSDEDVHKSERPDEAPRPGGASGNENGNPSGSSGNNNDDSEDHDDSDEDIESYVIINDNEEKDDSEGGNNEIPDENFNGDDTNDDEELYYLWPEIESCTSGIPSDSEKQKVLNRINYIRSIHGLPQVVYDTEGDEITAECSLIIAANNIEGSPLQLSHEPPKSWDCWSQQAYEGCHSSNIHVGWAQNTDLSSVDSAEIVDGFMIDKDVDSVGHRRWFLDPWLGHISFGRADYTDGNGIFVLGSAVKVIHDDKPDVSDLEIDFIAYPFESYPKKLYPGSFTRMSFTVLKDKINKFGNASSMNLASATIAIIDSTNNKTISVSGLKYDTDGIGVPNNISWLAEGIEYNKKYNVTVSNIMVNNVSTLYQYWFELK